jgi:predicted RNA-binding Zn-ribbon protein involved in translation (DUF1610 family)
VSQPKTDAIPGQTPRPGLDRALASLEEQSATGICPLCGREDLLRVKYGGRAFWDGEKMTPWMCPACAAAYLREHPLEGSSETADGQ